MLDAYLLELRQDLARRLPEEDLRARMAEAEDHLREGIEGRVELGLSQEEAEREAIKAFGQTQSIARATAPDAGRARRRWLDAYWALFAGVVLWSALDTPSMPDAVVGVSWLTLAVIAIGFRLATFRSGRPDPLAVLRRSFTALLAGTLLLLATHVVYDSDGVPQFVSRLRAAHTANEWEAMARLAGEHRVRDSSLPSGTDMPRLYRRLAAELNDANGHPLTNVAPAFRLSWSAVAMASVPALAFDLAFGVLGWLSRPRRGKRRAIGG